MFWTLSNSNFDDLRTGLMNIYEQDWYESILVSFSSPSDENVGPASSAFYLGIFYTMAIGELDKVTKEMTTISSRACHWLLSWRSFLNFPHRLLGGGQVDPSLLEYRSWFDKNFPVLIPPPGLAPGGFPSSSAGQLFSSYQYHSHGIYP